MNPDEEDDRTVVRPTGAGGSTVRVTRGGSGDVPPAAAAPSATQHTHTLPTGTRLGEFELTQTLGEGGFGIVYLAWDHSLQRKVALKEYMPSAIASRVGGTEIRPRSERHQETFEAGMKSFINEAKLLAQFDHPALVKVYRFWEANGTAYMVMPFYEGVTVRDAVRKFAEPPDEAWILALLEPLFHALSMLHGSQCFHRDIAPDNIMLLAPNERPLLLDFGAARRVIGDMTQALTAILKPGYAPVEQYAEVPGLKQGPWTDVYALAAVVHWVITGKTPPASVGRMFGDSYVPLVERAAGRYSPQFLAAIDRALVVLPDKRTPTIDALRHDMTSPSGAAPLPLAPGGPALRGDAPVPRADEPRTSPPGHAAWPATVEATRAAAQAPVPASPRPDEATSDEVTLPPRSATTAAAHANAGARTSARTSAGANANASADSRPKRWPLFAAIAGVLIAAGVAAVVWSSRTPAPALAQPPTASPGAAPTAATTPPSPVVAEPVVAPPAQETKPAVAETPPPATEARPPIAEAGPSKAEGRPGGTPAEPPSGPAIVAPPAEPRVATTRKPPPKPAATEPRAAEPRVVEPRAEPRAASADRDAECARLFARLSLGENNQELIDRVKTLRCR